jgi:hypothetical protein
MEKSLIFYFAFIYPLGLLFKSGISHLASFTTPFRPDEYNAQA